MAALIAAAALAIPATAGAANGTGATLIGTDATGFDSVLQADGKLIVVGEASADATNDDFAVARYNVNGTLDTSFGGDGIVATPIEAGDNPDQARGVALQDDGRIVVVGASRTNTTSAAFAVVRYNDDGTLDTSFGGGDGIVTTQVSSGAEIARDVAIQANGKIVAVGEADLGAGPGFNFALVRYNANGTLDTSFDGESGSGDGIITPAISPGSGFDGANSVLLQSDNKIVVGGAANGAGTQTDFAVIRLHPDGTFDDTTDSDPSVSWDGDGIATTAFSGSDVRENLFGLAIQPNDRVVAAGAASPSGFSDSAFARYKADGTPDTSFGGTGTVTFSLSSADDFADDVALQPDGKIVSAGSEHEPSGDARFAVVRLNSDGTFDDAADADPGVTFGGDGVVTTQIVPESTNDFAHAVALRTNGQIVVAGQSFFDGATHFAFARYDSTGNLDNSFVHDSDGPPNTTITSGPANGSTTGDSTPTFGFQSSQPGSTFACRVDSSNESHFEPCSGPGATDTTQHLHDGLHTIDVRARDSTAVADPTPATRTFTVVEDTTPPETTITKGPSGPTTDRTPTFRFRSSEANSSFECRLDRKPFKHCTSPRKFRKALGFGKHKFRVRATDEAGNTDATPDLRKFKIVR
jgi:uncharacterized delta-60 repeat protein